MARFRNVLPAERGRPRRAPRWAFGVTLALLTFPGLVARAEEDVQAASTAFAEGQRAQLRGDFPRAGELFEIADQAAPSPGALRSAIRNREAAGQDVRAATLALRAIERYGDDRETRGLADATIARLAGHLTRVRVRCGEPCTLTVDGGLVGLKASPATEFFVSPGPHVLEAHWAGREPASKAFEGAAGQVSDQELRPPAGTPAVAASATPAAIVAATPPGPAPTAEAASPAPRPAADAQSGSAAPAHHGLPPTVFWVGTGLTVVAGGILTWSGLDTMSARDRYVKDPTRDGFNDGKSRETRTNVLVATTAVLGAATIAVGLFATDFGQGKFVLGGAGRGSVALTFTGSLP
jgi:hypothetical protein